MNLFLSMMSCYISLRQNRARERGINFLINKQLKKMSTKRRDFLKLSGLTGVSLIGSGLLGKATGAVPVLSPFEEAGAPGFNMCGYAAPKLEKVRVGFIGLGMRGPTHVYGFSHIEGVEIKGLCDIRKEKVDAMEKQLSTTVHKPTSYSGDANAWKKMCDRKDIDLIVIATPWALHVPMAVYAMKAGKHVAIEVPAAKTLDECWQLVRTSESTKKHCMMLENCCYDFFELVTLNMVRQGYFGEVLHGEGAYLHDLLGLNFDKNGYYDMWRLRENYQRNGNLYATHGLGPIAQILNINRGDKMITLSSTSSDDFSMADKAKELAAKDPFYKEFVGKKYRGNMNVTNIRTQKGKTVTLYHDVSTERPYSRVHLVTGTKAYAVKYPEIKVSQGEKWLSETELKDLQEKYTPEIIKKVGNMAKKIGGHGGMDFMMQWHLIDCLRNGLPLTQDVYDAALWSAVSPLSEWSVAHNSNSIKVPDFTAGAWKTNHPVELHLEAGNTEVVAGTGFLSEVEKIGWV
jgi:hypothetical protein